MGAFADWGAMLMRKTYVRHAVAVAGNHDCTFDATHPRSTGSSRDVALSMLRDAGVVYLEDSSAAVAGLRFYASPWTPRFFDWAFQIDTEEQDRSVFQQVAQSTMDVLVTHGPPRGMRDRAEDGRDVGSAALAEAVRLARPRVHAFGHIHCGYGVTLRGGTLSINASSCTEGYRPTNPPIVIDIEAR